jgi:hypothetical protein
VGGAQPRFGTRRATTSGSDQQEGIMDQQAEFGTEDWSEISQEMRRATAEERHKSERLARQLSKESMEQWQRSIEGLLALPTAAALGFASSTLYIAAFIQRGFEVIQQSAEAVRSGVEQARTERQREPERLRQGAQERPSDGGRFRAEGTVETGRGEAMRGEVGDIH